LLAGLFSAWAFVWEVFSPLLFYALTALGVLAFLRPAAARPLMLEAAALATSLWLWHRHRSQHEPARVRRRTLVQSALGADAAHAAAEPAPVAPHSEDERVEPQRLAAAADATAWVLPRWMDDDESEQCVRCQREFSLFLRRHHCRRCGVLCCDGCSSRRALFPGAQRVYSEPVRVCDECYGACTAR
jgi:hypothetical protein